MPSRGIRCTVNLEIWYSIDGLYRPYHVPQDQLYDYISYSKHKRRQLSDRLAIARNKIQCNYIMPSGSIKPKNIVPIKSMKTKSSISSLINESPGGEMIVVNKGRMMIEWWLNSIMEVK